MNYQKSEKFDILEPILIIFEYCQAQFQSSPSPVQLELRLALSLIITTPAHPPTHPGK